MIKYIFVAYLRHKNTARHLHGVVGKYGDDFKLFSRIIIVYFKVMFFACSLPGKFAAFLKGDTHHITAYLVVVGIEIEVFVLEVIHGERFSLFVFAFFRPHGRHHTDASWVDVGKCSFFKMMHNAVGFYVLIHILLSVGQLQSGMSVFIAVDVLCATQWEKACVELDVVGFLTFERGKSLLVAECERLTILRP